MKICISGLTASGKSTLAEELSKALGIKHIHKSYKEYVDSYSKLADFTASADKKFANSFDAEIKKLANGDCVVSTWLSPWMIEDATLRIWLNASESTRSKRRAAQHNEVGGSDISAIEGIDKAAINQAKRIYDIDIFDHSIFDIEINTEKMSIMECASAISIIALERDRKNF
ncbi:cytidylate kinase family protein [Candidatus Marsarchaeota archaeon]|jgi:cytidylate kinase|nr:cytidylate kinase family protein [Candidatus Marsarchaeota archaeon]MCL5092316.1 cytidylate kinase family protein [Candidatus Marsarchaeota archaeon]